VTSAIGWCLRLNRLSVIWLAGFFAGVRSG